VATWALRQTGEMDIDQPSLGCAYFNQLDYRYLDPSSHGVDAALELTVTDALFGPTGAVHAGITTLMADVAGAMAIASRTQRAGASSSVSVQCLGAARVGPIRALATMLRASKHSAMADVRVIDVGNDDRLVAVAHVTCGLFAPTAP
jgi:uncharacterized protein (TIGR00369 family)